jgi:hypothetical protein
MIDPRILQDAPLDDHTDLGRFSHHAAPPLNSPAP